MVKSSAVEWQKSWVGYPNPSGYFHRTKGKVLGGSLTHISVKARSHCSENENNNDNDAKRTQSIG